MATQAILPPPQDADSCSKQADLGKVANPHGKVLLLLNYLLALGRAYKRAFLRIFVTEIYGTQDICD